MMSSHNSNFNKQAPPDEFTMNQCSLMVRVDGQSLEIPLNFGMTADEIRKLYPYLLQFANIPMKNPAVEFGTDKIRGIYSELSDDDIKEKTDQINKQARYWYGKSEASLLEIAVRFALDIKLLGIQELVNIFMPESPLDRYETEPVEPLSEEESQHVIEEMKLETETDYEHDPGDENDIALGIGGDLNVNIYDSTFNDDYFSKELDELEKSITVQDRFDEIISKDIADMGGEDHYKGSYVSGKLDKLSVNSNGLLTLYGDDDSDGVFREFDLKDESNNSSVDQSSNNMLSDDISDFDINSGPTDTTDNANAGGYDWNSEDED